MKKNKHIRIINSFEEYKRKNKLKDDESNNLYENENEIKEKCKIEINDGIIPFNYFYKFNKTGKHKIKYIFNENIRKTDFLFKDCSSFTNLNLSNFNT